MFHDTCAHPACPAGDGVYAVIEGSSISLHDLKTNSTNELVSLFDIKDEHGIPLSWAEWKLSKDMKYLLVKANYLKVTPLLSC